MTPAGEVAGGACPDLPRLVEGIASWPFFPERRNRRGEVVDEAVAIVGSLDLDRFLTVPARKLRAVETILRVLGQSHSVEEAEERLRREGLRTDLPELCDKLGDAGLVLDETGRPVPADSPLERNFVRVARVGLSPVAPLFRWLGRRLEWILLVWMALAGLAWGLEPRGVLDPLSSLLGVEGTTLSGVITGLLLLGGSFLIHETSHGAVAARFGRVPRKFELGFYLGFLPTFFLRVGGLYTLTPRQRVAVWAAGPASNLILAATSAWVALHAGSGSAGLWTRAAYLNLALGLFNLVPFLPTDGYFIASTLLRRTNVRRNAWSSLRAFFAGGRRPGVILGAYLVGFGGVVSYLLGGRLLRIASEFSAHPVDSALRLALTVGLTALVAFRWRKAKRARALRRRNVSEVSS